jgi:uncharacterized protein (TIGR03083 family)
MTGPAPGFGLLARAVSYALASATYATPDLLPRATPCTGWDLATLLDHLSDSLAVLHDAVGDRCVRPGPAVGRGAEAAVRDGTRRDAGHHSEPGAEPRPDLVTAVRWRAGRLLAACAHAGTGEHAVAIADRQLTTGVVAVTGAIEVSVHGWDISAACGHRNPIPPLLAAEMLVFAPLLIPADAREGLFGDPVWLPGPGCPSDELVAFLGRQPGWPAVI